MRRALPKWVWKCPQCKLAVTTYVKLVGPPVCTNHSLRKPVYMTLTSQPSVDTDPNP